MEAFNKKTLETLRQIMSTELPEMEKLVQGFDWVTTRVIESTQNEIDLARAMHDSETAVKQQIKMETLKSARNIFENCYIQATGSRTKLWKE
ncbi:MAG: hypothetical protein JXA33_28570 [Anaerolineae bacterium]|nr:hypothetical protein [Anaerolineae bacterium]